MQALKREGENPPCRIGLTVSRRLGSAVARNRAKRRLREMVRLSGVSERLAGWDIVLIGRALPREREFSLMKQDFLQGLAKLGVLP